MKREKKQLARNQKISAVSGADYSAVLLSGDDYCWDTESDVPAYQYSGASFPRAGIRKRAAE